MEAMERNESIKERNDSMVKWERLRSEAREISEDLAAFSYLASIALVYEDWKEKGRFVRIKMQETKDILISMEEVLLEIERKCKNMYPEAYTDQEQVRRLSRSHVPLHVKLEGIELEGLSLFQEIEKSNVEVGDKEKWRKLVEYLKRYSWRFSLKIKNY
ncbi:MAG: hypothetical protein OXB88_09390, partial [Bacteriovoracales bacterium]|nr:hypothetical protein [Bacteriovoracales bacterium]